MTGLRSGTGNGVWDFQHLSSVIEAFRGNYPHAAAAVLDLFARIQRSEPYCCERTPRLTRQVAEALPWLSEPRIKLVDLRSMQSELATRLFDSFCESSLGREMWPRDTATYKAALSDLKPFIARLDDSLQTALHKFFGELTETYELSFFGFVAFKACCALLSVEEGAFQAGFAQLLVCFENGIHVPGLDRDGNVLVLVK